jgi:hypothetical protein
VRNTRGAVSVVSLVLLLGLVAAAYAGWLYIPAYLDNFDVREASSAAFNRMATDSENERIRFFLLDRMKRIGTHWENEGGTYEEKPGLGITDEDVHIDRDAAEHTARIQVDYQRQVKLWPSERLFSIDFHVEKAGKLAQ